MSGRANSVKRFERSNGLDTALYKNRHFLYFLPLSLCQGIEGVKNMTTWTSYINNYPGDSTDNRKA